MSTPQRPGETAAVRVIHDIADLRRHRADKLLQMMVEDAQEDGRAIPTCAPSDLELEARAEASIAALVAYLCTDPPPRLETVRAVCLAEAARELIHFNESIDVGLLRLARSTAWEYYADIAALHQRRLDAPPPEQHRA